MINLLREPAATLSKASAMMAWCFPDINPGHMLDTKVR
jgi:hypothetical protein